MDTTTITIQGKDFSVPMRYPEGHELTAGEASALNQTYHENIRNNLAGKMKKGEDITQETVDAYAEAYQFGVRAAGGGAGSRDPVKSEAMRIATAKIREALKAKNQKAEATQIREAAERLITDPVRGAPIMEMARKRVEEARSVATANLDDLLGATTETVPAETAAA